MGGPRTTTCCPDSPVEAGSLAAKMGTALSPDRGQPVRSQSPVWPSH